jgi:hypothetical protein
LSLGIRHRRIGRLNVDRFPPSLGETGIINDIYGFAHQLLDRWYLHPVKTNTFEGGQKDLEGIARVRRRRRAYSSNEDYVTTTPHGAYR